MNPAPITNLAALQGHLAAGAKTLGTLVYWNNVADVRIGRARFRAAFDAMGLGGAVGRDPKAEACLNMAAAVASRRQRLNTPAVKIQLKEKGTHAVYAVLMRRDLAVPGEAARVRYIEEARVAIPRDQHAPTAQYVTASDVAPDDERDEVIADMISEYDDLLLNIRTAEFSKALVAAMSLLGGLSLRAGVYFVPAASMPQLNELRRFVADHTTVALTTWIIGSNDANLAQARTDARSALLDRVGTLVEECRAFATAKVDDLSARSINARLKRFGDLEGQATLYADILGDRVDELRQTIADAKKAFRDSVLGPDDVPLRSAS